MEVKTTLSPGQNGTKQLVSKYGDQLVCVRYRYDRIRQKRYKTVELIVDEQAWMPGVIIPADKKVPIRIEFGEIELREIIKKEGAYWNLEKKYWTLSYRKVMELGLERRILDEELDM